MSAKPDIKIGPDFNPGAARWCGEHNKLECAKNRSKGRGACHGPAIRGTDACTIHGGVSRDAAKVRGEAKISAWSAVGTPASPTVDAGMAVLGMLQQSWLRANLYSQLLRRQVAKDEQSLGAALLDPGDPESPSGLIGFRYGAAGKDGNIYAVSEEARGLVVLEAAERDRVVRYAKTAHDMGISERLTSLAESWGDLVVTRIMVVLAGLSLTQDQEDLVPALIEAHLGSIELGMNQP